MIIKIYFRDILDCNKFYCIFLPPYHPDFVSTFEVKFADCERKLIKKLSGYTPLSLLPLWPLPISLLYYYSFSHLFPPSILILSSPLLCISAFVCKCIIYCLSKCKNNMHYSLKYYLFTICFSIST